MNRATPSYTLVVQGRFHAFALAKALLALGMPVRVLTNYPAFLAERFGLPAKYVTGCGSLGLMHRYCYRWNIAANFPVLPKLLHQSFSRWAAKQLLADPPDLVHAFSGVAKEIYDAFDRHRIPTLRLLARGSAHIREQYRDLHRESVRAEAPDMDLPDPWMIQREMEEYRRSHHILTLSSYARESFLTRGYSPEKVLMLPLGSNVKQFRPERAVIERRLERLRSGKKPIALYTGNVSLQKGIVDLIETARALAGKVHFRVVGNITPDAVARTAAAQGLIEFLPRVSEHTLPEVYSEADVFVFPTLHDGFAAVLAQARAACLPVIATDHCAAPDMIADGTNGWIVPTRRPDLFVEKLRMLEQNRALAAAMVENLWEKCDTRDWSDVGRDFILLAARILHQRGLETPS